MMSKYYSINKFSKILGVSAQTLRNCDKNGKLHHLVVDYKENEQIKQENLLRNL
jgi:ribosomal protein L28